MYPSMYDKITGIFVQEQIKALIHSSINIRVISPIPYVIFPINYLSPKWHAYSEIPEQVFYEGVDVYYPMYLVFPKALFLASSGKRMFAGIKNFVSKIYQEFPFDLIHAHVALPDGYAAMLLSKLYQKPFIVTIHGQDLQQTIFRNRKCKVNIKQTIDSSKKTILVSRKLEQIAQKELNIDKSKLTVIPNGISLDKICLDKRSMNGKYAKKTIILSVANLTREKGIDLGIKAVTTLLKRHPNLLYIIVGEGPEKPKLIKLVKWLGVERNVKFLGKQSHEKVMEYMSLCDIFLLPSWNEAFGIVYIEAMAHGKPVIGVRGQGIDGIIVNRKNGMLVEPHSVDDIVDTVDFLISYKEEAIKMGERARKLVLENYTWEKNAQKTIEVYKEVLGGE